MSRENTEVLPDMGCVRYTFPPIYSFKTLEARKDEREILNGADKPYLTGLSMLVAEWLLPTWLLIPPPQKCNVLSSFSCTSIVSSPSHGRVIFSFSLSTSLWIFFSFYTLYPGFACRNRVHISVVHFVNLQLNLAPGFCDMATPLCIH